MHMMPTPDRRQLLLLIMAVAALVPLYAPSWDLAGGASARFGGAELSQERAAISAQFSLSFGA